jgi:glycosyltransferase involved in cell wall biosynthesis
MSEAHEEEGMLIGAVLVVRDEEELLERNLAYHLDAGFDIIAVLDHCSRDRSVDILQRAGHDKRIVVFREDNPVFDNERLVNWLLGQLLQRARVDWIFPLDADEFLFFKDGLRPFLERMEEEKINYASLGWVNALAPYKNRENPKDVLSTFRFYRPWPERPWQEIGHFRKSFVRLHSAIEIVAGGHYFRREKNPTFFSDKNFEPTQVDISEACIYHYELRNSPRALVKKWENLSRKGVCISSLPRQGWVERIQLFRQYLELFGTNLEAVERRWFVEERTIWGNPIPVEATVQNWSIADWNRAYQATNLRGELAG